MYTHDFFMDVSSFKVEFSPAGFHASNSRAANTSAADVSKRCDSISVVTVILLNLGS